MLLLFHLNANGVGDIDEFAYIQYMEVENAVSIVYRALVCLYLWWAAADEDDITLKFSQRLRGTPFEEGVIWTRSF